jgi:hypothetical protein
MPSKNHLNKNQKNSLRLNILALSLAVAFISSNMAWFMSSNPPTSPEPTILESFPQELDIETSEIDIPLEELPETCDELYQIVCQTYPDLTPLEASNCDHIRSMCEHVLASQ